MYVNPSIKLFFRTDGMWGLGTGGSIRGTPDSWTKKVRRWSLCHGPPALSPCHPSSWKAGRVSVFGLHWPLALSAGPDPGRTRTV